jgi:hypothetical protein
MLSDFQSRKGVDLSIRTKSIDLISKTIFEKPGRTNLAPT